MLFSLLYLFVGCQLDVCLLPEKLPLEIKLKSNRDFIELKLFEVSSKDFYIPMEPDEWIILNDTAPNQDDAPVLILAVVYSSRMVVY